MSRPGFWDDPEEARAVSARFSRVQGRIELLDGLKATLSDSEELLELAEEDGELLSEVEEELRRVERVLEEQEVARLFSGEYDEGDAILTINPGAGGVDSQDWAEMLARMYRRWVERRGFGLEVIEYTEGEEAGIKSATFTVSGEYAFGLLSAERGVHRLVRISPFDAGARRHTSFASVAVAPVVGEASRSRSRRRTSRSTRTGRRGPVGSTSTRPILRSGSRTSPRASWRSARTSGASTRTARWPCGSYGRGSSSWSARSGSRRSPRRAGRRPRSSGGPRSGPTSSTPTSSSKDHRTGEETANVDRVLDGDLDAFIYAYLKTRTAA